MRTISEAYTTYRIPPNLQMHQLRVAAVGKTICDSFDTPIDTQAVVLACLLHDMGNIIKFDFSLPLDDKAEDIPHWREVQREFIEQYGTDEHAATLDIIKEIGVDAAVMELINGVGFSKLERTRDNGSLEQKVCEYADLRVAPTGVVSLDERIKEGRARYSARNDVRSDLALDDARHSVLVVAIHQIEQQIFAHASIKPEDITNESAGPTIEALRSYNVS